MINDSPLDNRASTQIATEGDSLNRLAGKRDADETSNGGKLVLLSFEFVQRKRLVSRYFSNVVPIFQHVEIYLKDVGKSSILVTAGGVD